MMREKEYIAYSGMEFTVEWYFDRYLKSQSLAYYNSMSLKERVGVMQLFKRMGDVGKLKDRTKFNYEGDQIYAFKPHSDWFLCFFTQGRKIIITNAFEKKRQKLPVREKEKSLINKSDYEARIREGNYYG